MSPLIDWLASSQHYPKFFWKPKHAQKAVAALGKTKETQAVPESPPSRMFGGLFFSSATPQTALWNAFSSPYFFEPKMVKEDKVISQPSRFENSFHSRVDTPSQMTWLGNVKKTVEAIESGQLNKAVLARMTTLEFDLPVSPWELLQSLCAISQNATLFAFQPTSEICFLGATPEFLYVRDKSNLVAEAIAGTCPLAFPDATLLNSSKDLHEFTLVKEAIEHSLSPFCESLSWNRANAILKTTHVKHLHNTLEAKLKLPITDAHLIEALHPTPAMGGDPKHAALEWIQSIEPFLRGLYSAPIGWIGPNGAELAVGIRSCLVKDKTIHLFAGAGIVKNSDPSREWDELEAKISPFLTFLRAYECSRATY